jgi:hypothetical protein
MQLNSASREDWLDLLSLVHRCSGGGRTLWPFEGQSRGATLVGARRVQLGIRAMVGRATSAVRSVVGHALAWRFRELDLCLCGCV